MIDYDKMHDNLKEKCLQATRDHARAVEEQIKKVIDVYNVNPSQLELECHPEFYYKIKIKAAEFKFEHNFKVEIE